MFKIICLLRMCFLYNIIICFNKLIEPWVAITLVAHHQHANEIYSSYIDNYIIVASTIFYKNFFQMRIVNIIQTNSIFSKLCNIFLIKFLTHDEKINSVWGRCKLQQKILNIREYLKKNLTVTCRWILHTIIIYLLYYYIAIII